MKGAFRMTDTDRAEVSTKDRPGLYDAIETAKPGEPLFPIQGGDPFGPATVQFWVDQCRRAGMAETDEKRAKDLLEKASSAEHVVWAMQDYQRGLTAKVEPGKKAQPTYSGWLDTDDDETKQRRQERAGRIAAAGRVNNAAAVATEAIETLAKLRCCPEQEARLREAVAAMTEAAFQIEPRRGRERS
jgi:hypothetical protein